MFAQTYVFVQKSVFVQMLFFFTKQIVYKNLFLHFLFFYKKCTFFLYKNNLQKHFFLEKNVKKIMLQFFVGTKKHVQKQHV